MAALRCHPFYFNPLTTNIRMETQHGALTKAFTAAADDAAKAAIGLKAIDVVKQLETALNAAADENIGLQAQLDAANTGKKLKPTFKNGKDTYQVEHAVKLNGTTYTVEQIAENAEVQKALVKGESTAITKQEKVTE